MWHLLFKPIDDDEIHEELVSTFRRRRRDGTYSTREVSARSSTPTTVSRFYGTKIEDGIDLSVHGNYSVMCSETSKYKWLYAFDEIFQQSDEEIEPFDDNTSKEEEIKMRNSRWTRILGQSIIPVILSGCGLVLAGWMFQLIQKSEVFLDIHELNVLVTPLLGLKAQLELASVTRFTTHLSTDNIPKYALLNYCIADLAVSLVTTILAAVYSAFFAIFWISIQIGVAFAKRNICIWTLLAIACSAASVTCLVTGVITIGATLLCLKYRLDPNVVAVPVGASIGDITTIGTLYFFADFFFKFERFEWFAPLASIVFIILVPVLTLIADKHPATRSSLWASWLPTICAITISGAAGFILQYGGPNMVLYQPLVTGVAGTLLAIHFCRIVLTYKRTTVTGRLPKGSDGKRGGVWFWPCLIVCPQKVHTPTYLIILGITVPVFALFSVFIWAFVPNHEPKCYGIFLSLYLSSCFILIAFVLYLSHILLNCLWKMRADPGFYVIPCMHGVGDVLGTLLLLGCCRIYSYDICKA